MKIAIVASNIIPINQNVQRGTEYFVYLLTTFLARKKRFDITLFASKDSNLPVKLESVNYLSSFNDPDIGRENHKIFELALISKAFRMTQEFDLYHINISSGEFVLPFVFFTKKPVVITLHSPLNKKYAYKYYSLFKEIKNLYFISISNNQRKNLPFLNYFKTIYHGIDKNTFIFNPQSSDYLLWIGRGIPEKGLEDLVKVIYLTKKKAKIYIHRHINYENWLKEKIEKPITNLKKITEIEVGFEVNKQQIVNLYNNAKLFLFPILWEEPFGLVMIESMACGTPVVAFARGSVPEVIKDGETGFIVNPSDDDVRGNWIIKKTGIEGLCEAVERIYSMPEDQYRQMRRNCQAHVEKYFTVERMVDEYEKVYQEIIERSKRR